MFNAFPHVHSMFYSCLIAAIWVALKFWLTALHVQTPHPHHIHYVCDTSLHCAVTVCAYEGIVEIIMLWLYCPMFLFAMGLLPDT